MQWNLNVQREVIPNLTVVLGYVGSRGVHQLFRIDDANIVLPTLTSAGYLWPVSGGTQVNSVNTGAIRFVDWGGDSFYEGLQLGVQKRMSHGLQVQGSFTWGKSIDNNSGAIAGDTLANSITSLYWFDLHTSRGVSDYNIGRVLVINGSWQIPSSKAGGLLGWASNGWQIGGILKVNDGLPLTPTLGSGGDPLGEKSSDPFDFPNRLTTPNCASPINPRNVAGYIKTECFGLPTAPTSVASQCISNSATAKTGFFNAVTPASSGTVYCSNLAGNAGRNIIVGPGLINLDSSLFKNNYIRAISENFNAQFRLEIFNILNRANFNVPALTSDNILTQTGGSDSNAGLLQSTVTNPRQIQFALKLTW